MLTTSGGYLSIEEYDPKSRTSSSEESQKILLKLRKQLNSPESDSRGEIEKLKNLMKNDKSIQKEITKQIVSSVPKTIQKGSVGEVLYGCIQSGISARSNSCAPECIVGPPLSDRETCNTPTYIKTKNGIKKINSVEGSDANIYNYSESNELTQDEEEQLRSEGISNVLVYSRKEGTTKYEQVNSTSLSSHSDTRSKSDDSEDPKGILRKGMYEKGKKKVSYSPDTSFDKKEKPTKSSKNCSPSTSTKESSSVKSETSCSVSSCSLKEEGWSLGYIIAAVVVIFIVLAIIFAILYFVGSAEKGGNGDFPSHATTATTQADGWM